MAAGIYLAVFVNTLVTRSEDDGVHGHSRCGGQHKQTATAEHFVVRVRRQA